MDKYGIINIENSLEDAWYEVSKTWKDNARKDFERNEMERFRDNVSELKEAVFTIINVEEMFLDVQKTAEKLIDRYKEEDDSKKSSGLYL